MSVAEWQRPDRPKYRGITCQQFPSDLERYRELIRELRPPFIVEIGSAEGGTALLLADELGHVDSEGVLVSVDIAGAQPKHDRIVYVHGSSTHEDAVRTVYQVAAGRRGLILLDGDHTAGHVALELAIYADLASYLVVEDTIMRHLPGVTYGPHDALDAWLPEHPEFAVDPDPVPTQHPGGWLRRIH